MNFFIAMGKVFGFALKNNYDFIKYIWLYKALVEPQIEYKIQHFSKNT